MTETDQGSDDPGSSPPIPEQLMPLSWLLGTWVGVGLGSYPGIDDFRFGQEVSFSTDGRPFISYASRAWILDEAGERVRPAGSELGFWRPQHSGKRVEFLLTHPTGFVEIYLGEVDVTSIENGKITGARVELATDVVARTGSAKDYSAGRRLYGLIGSDLGWTFDMAAMGHPMTSHLSAQLAKVG